MNGPIAKLCKALTEFVNLLSLVIWAFMAAAAFFSICFLIYLVIGEVGLISFLVLL